MNNKNTIAQCLKALSEKLKKEEFMDLVNSEYEKGNLLNPRCDPIFKILFTLNSKESNLALKCFLSAVLDKKVIEVVLQPTELPKESLSDKDALFDVSCRFADSNEYFDIELQGRNIYNSYDKRAEYYVSHLLNHYTQKGTNWKRVPKVYQVSVLNFNFLRSNDDIVDWYVMKNISNDTLAERLNIIFVYLKKVFRQYSDIEKLDIKSLTSVEKWCIFFLCADDKEYKALVDELAQREDGIMEAQKVLSEISEDELNWRRQKSYYEVLSRDATIRGEAADEGYNKGLEQGAHERAIENAKNFLKMNILSLEQIAQGTGLSLEEVQKIAETQKEV